MSKKYSIWNFVRNQSLAAAFLAIEVMAALHIGFPHPLAWLLTVVAVWNAGLIVLRTLGLVMLAVKTLNDEDARS